MRKVKCANCGKRFDFEKSKGAYNKRTKTYLCEKCYNEIRNEKMDEGPPPIRKSPKTTKWKKGLCIALWMIAMTGIGFVAGVGYARRDGSNLSAAEKVPTATEKALVSTEKTPTTTEPTTVAPTTVSPPSTTAASTTTEATTIQQTEAEKTEATTQPTTPAKPESTVYKAGTYLVGKTIPAGEYVIYPDRAGRSLYVKVCSDANGDDIIYNEIMDGAFIATVYDGEFFTIERGHAEAFTGNEFIDTTADSFVVKVGVHIEPGLYLATAKSDNRSGYYCIYTDSRYDNIVSNDIFDNTAFLSVEAGQYLKIERCTIEKQ
ncbi:MAG: hypothetical protein IKM88_05590 [Lachnospiraceae bacterium]|nr:hypothetical protein [Lachnospiraceae bacterium]